MILALGVLVLLAVAALVFAAAWQLIDEFGGWGPWWGRAEKACLWITLGLMGAVVVLAVGILAVAGVLMVTGGLS